MHGLIFFYIQKFADSLAGSGSWPGIRSTVTTASQRYLPSGVYPDDEAVALITSLAEATGRTMGAILEEFGEFLAPHLVKVAGRFVEPSWKTLDLIEHTETVIHAMVRTANPGALPPVIESVRAAADEVHVVYSSRRQLCQLAVGLMHGLATHFGETLEVKEPTCMHRGDPFCSFVVRTAGPLTASALRETVELPTLSPDRGDRTTVFGDPAFGGGRSVEAGQAGIPVQIGGYPIEKLLGEGGMGRVYLARDERLGRSVAIKVMLPRKAGDESSRRRFLRESRSAAAVEHENIVTIHQVGEHLQPGEPRGLPYIVMQRLEGSTLAAHRQRTGKMPLPEALRIGREVAAGLAAAHERGLVHRDIKPENVWLEGRSRHVKIIDFGLARDAGEDSTKLTVDGAIVGTPAYMSPERIADQSIDAKGDIFGLGVILYELLSGRLPFEGRSMVSTLAAIAHGHPTPLEEIAPEVPREVSTLVMRMISHEKADRPDAGEVVAAIAAIERSLAG